MYFSYITNRTGKKSASVFNFEVHDMTCNIKMFLSFEVLIQGNIFKYVLCLVCM